ncbi:MAG TPA: ATP-binding cassette domain-containing protein [Mycobacteriales bacterium]|nr:ATP-binding cassette domain-containing protein [Mycobacteriales bacterium]
MTATSTLRQDTVDTSVPDGQVLAVRGLTKHFTMHLVDDRVAHALAGVDLDVAAGEHVALAGASGAGKSTLLRCVYRTYLASGGRISFRTRDGDVVDLATMPDANVRALRGQEIGYVSQFLRAEPRRAVLDIVARAGVARGMNADRARKAAAEALARVGIDEALWPVHATVLSGGQKQRVNIAAGTISPPRLLLLDEPVSALDPANRGSVLDMIGELESAGVAVLSVFHDLDAIERLARRVVVLRAGQVVESGPPDVVLRSSAHYLEVAR